MANSSDYPPGMHRSSWIKLGYLDDENERSDTVWDRLEQQCEDEGWEEDGKK